MFRVIVFLFELSGAKMTYLCPWTRLVFSLLKSPELIFVDSLKQIAAIDHIKTFILNRGQQADVSDERDSTDATLMGIASSKQNVRLRYTFFKS